YHPTTYINTLSLHDALPIFLTEGDQLVSEKDLSAQFDSSFSQHHFQAVLVDHPPAPGADVRTVPRRGPLLGSRKLLARQRFRAQDRKSTRLNSSHLGSSYAV